MAASYWDSTQRQNWTFTKPKLAIMRSKMEDESRSLHQKYPLPDRRLLSWYFSQQIQRLAKKLQTNLRQQAMATAQIYVKRYYLTVEVRRTNPYLVLSAALYIACKMEECPQHIRIIVVEAHNLWPESVAADISKLGECEFAIIAELSSQLIVHHPYRSLSDLQPQFGLETEETTLAWSIINDHYLTDLPLLYPPYVIAITACFLAVVLRPTHSGPAQLQAASLSKALESVGAANSSNGPSSGPNARIPKMVNWLAESSVSMEAVVDCTQELISLYDVWEGYNEKTCKDRVAAFATTKGR